MGEPAPADSGPAGAAAGGRSNLLLRVVSSAILAPLAIGLAWWGGWPFNLFWSLACVLVLGEWLSLVSGEPDPGRRTAWIVAGIVYAGGILVATLLLRSDPQFGFAAILFLFAVVWLTDIAAYFSGRAFGGPKLMPRVSPKKTWSGAIGGTAAGVAGGIAVGLAMGAGAWPAIAALAFVLSAVSQAGDLMESALKRRFGAKDSGQIIPGHGGLMDRLDGYATAVLAAALIGLSRGGLDAAGAGLMVW